MLEQMPNARMKTPVPKWLSFGLQFLVVLAVLGGLWLLDPLGWRQTAVTDTPQEATVYSTLTQIENLQGRLSQDPQNAAMKVELATLYLQYVRESGDPSYYNKADALLQQALEQDPNNLFAVVQMGNLALARHEFRDALVWGEKAAALNDRHWLAYGIIGDAHVELGEYDAARAAFDKMATLRPDINSYSRISYMRELLGDTRGAIQAMTLATRASLPTSEASNWARVQLGHLNFNSGKLDEAEALYKSSLDLYPNYLHALAGMGRVRAARGDYDGAIRYYKQALAQMPFPEYVIALGDVYQAAGNPAEAKKQYELVEAIQQLFASNGVVTDLELALFNADQQIRPAESVKQARTAYEKRPSIFAADVLAWALYQNGEYAEAANFSDRALGLGMQDALKYFHAGMIAAKLGKPDKARENLEKALTINPYFSLKYAPVARQTLAELR
jgi:tetratricopeptide (TPR) repeat protein